MGDKTQLLAIGAREAGLWRLVGELALGVAIGVAVPWLTVRIEQSRFFAVAGSHQPLFALSMGLLVYALVTGIGFLGAGAILRSATSCAA